MDRITKLSEIEKKFHDLSTRIVAECGLELYDIEYLSGSGTLRVFIIDKATGTAVIEDCVKVDRAFDPYCEAETWLPENFTLEVSSPGVYRNLKTVKHLEDVKGKKVLAKLKNFIDESGDILPKSLGKNKKLTGILESFDKERLVLVISGHSVNIEFDNIKTLNLNPDIV